MISINDIYIYVNQIVCSYPQTSTHGTSTYNKKIVSIDVSKGITPSVIISVFIYIYRPSKSSKLTLATYL